MSLAQELRLDVGAVDSQEERGWQPLLHLLHAQQHHDGPRLAPHVYLEVLGLMGYGWPFEFSTAYVIDQNSLIIGFNVVVLLLTVLYHLAAYQLFRRMQLINNKWVNL